MRPYHKKTLHKNRAGRVAEGEGLEFKTQDHKINNTIKMVFLKT
jgi:hypothetical protein